MMTSSEIMCGEIDVQSLLYLREGKDLRLQHCLHERPFIVTLLITDNDDESQ